MDENKLRFGVGVLVISAIGIGIILTFLFGAFPSVLSRDYNMSIKFPSAEGINANSAVVRDGVKIGHVNNIQLLDQGGVLVSVSLDANQKLTHRYIPRIGSGSFVTGDAKLEFVRATERELATNLGDKADLIDQPYGDGDFIDYGTKASSMFEMQGDILNALAAIRTAGDSISTAGENVSGLATEVREVVGGTDKKIEELTDEVVKTLGEFQGAIQDVREIVGDPALNENLQRSAAKLPELLTEANETLETTQKTLDSFGRAGDQFEQVGKQAEEGVVLAKGVVEEVGKGVGDARTTIQTVGKSIEKTLQSAEGTVANAEKTFGNLAEFTEPLAKNGDRVVGEVLQTLDQLQGSLVEIQQFGQTLNNSDGTVKRLLEDDEIYFQIRRTVENIELATSRIRPILDDVRVFSDKIARDPRQLGIRGAITKQPNNVGLK
jgi:phospholipid/cholesterol/gamma-HCH transport system substrate-binding protein